MRNLWCVLAAILLIGCGSKDDGVIEIDTGVGEVDAGIDTGTMADAGGDETPGETVRDDLEIVLADREVTFENGESERLSFEVPDDAVSVTVSVTGGPGKFYSLAEWANGDGSEIVGRGWLSGDQAAPSLCLSCTNRIASSEASFAAVVPNNRKIELVAGSHTLRAYGYNQSGFSTSPLSSGTATVRVVAKRLPSQPDTGTLDINFYFTGSNGWTADTAPDDEEFQTLVSDVEELYDQVGLEVGVVTYSDIPEEFQVIESVVLPNSELQEMFALSVDQPRNAINVFLVEELMTGFGGGFGVLLGVSGGIPGPPVAGTHRSGVAVATKADPQIPTPVYKVLGHEIGHHLGLFHTTEQALGGPEIHDPIDDTGQNDTSLLMYHSGGGDTITTTQGEVMRRSPWVNHGGAE